MKRKLLLASFMIAAVLTADVLTKRWALAMLDHGSTVHAAGVVPLTLAYNTGIAFGLPIPSAGRWFLVAASLFVILMLAGMFHQARPNAWLRLSSVALVTAGALGNLLDRVRWDRGVIDFIGPIDLGFMHFPIFNVADMAITIGAILLGLSLWREDAEPQVVPALSSADSGSPE